MGKMTEDDKKVLSEFVKEFNEEFGYNLRTEELVLCQWKDSDSTQHPIIVKTEIADNKDELGKLEDFLNVVSKDVIKKNVDTLIAAASYLYSKVNGYEHYARSLLAISELTAKITKDAYVQTVDVDSEKKPDESLTNERFVLDFYDATDVASIEGFEKNKIIGECIGDLVIAAAKTHDEKHDIWYHIAAIATKNNILWGFGIESSEEFNLSSIIKYAVKLWNEYNINMITAWKRIPKKTKSEFTEETVKFLIKHSEDAEDIIHMVFLDAKVNNKKKITGTGKLREGNESDEGTEDGILTIVKTNKIGLTEISFEMVSGDEVFAYDIALKRKVSYEACRKVFIEMWNTDKNFLKHGELSDSDSKKLQVKFASKLIEQTKTKDLDNETDLEEVVLKIVANEKDKIIQASKIGR